MTGDDDLKAFLPDAPPPAPKRREMAIAEALARFDGATPPQTRPRPEKVSWWNSLRHPQAGLLATAALVAAISLPLAWTALGPRLPAADEQVGRDIGDSKQIAVRSEAKAPVPVPKTDSPSSNAKPVAVKESMPRSMASPLAAKPVELAQTETMAPAAKAEPSEPIVVQGRSAPRPALAAASPVSAISSDTLSEDNSVVVTGTRITKRAPPRRGDWNACTVNDPSQKLAQCNRLADKGAKDVRAQADAHLSDGLKHAWEGDLDEAIVAFDQAIAVAPDLSVAYLNRGLAYDRQGESGRAIADLDRAVRHAPQSARAYYNRSLLLRKQGDARRADLDERRATNLDPRYQAAPRPD